MRVAIYARFSSDLQGRPIHNHQIAMAHPARGQAGLWLIAAEFTDAATSGASMANRPGLERARHRMKF
jgi:DNA invertase Pin-like site-specific DNA recombinase